MSDLSARDVHDKATEIHDLAIHIHEAMDVVYNIGDDKNGMAGFATLVKHALAEVESLADDILTDARKRHEAAGAVAVAAVPAKKAVRA